MFGSGWEKRLAIWRCRLLIGSQLRQSLLDLLEFRSVHRTSGCRWQQRADLVSGSLDPFGHPRVGLETPGFGAALVIVFDLLEKHWTRMGVISGLVQVFDGEKVRLGLEDANRFQVDGVDRHAAARKSEDHGHGINAGRLLACQ